MSGWYYLSFADDERWLGGCYVAALDDFHAVILSHSLGINPGGEVVITGPVTDEQMDSVVPPEDRHRLLSLGDISDPVEVEL